MKRPSKARRVKPRRKADANPLALPPGVFPSYAAFNPYLQTWLSLTSYERARRSDLLRKTITDLRRVHDEKTYRDFGPL